MADTDPSPEIRVSEATTRQCRLQQRDATTGYDLFGFVVVVTFYAGTAGAVVGGLWSFAVGASLLSGASWGMFVSAGLFPMSGLGAVASGRVTFREAALITGSLVGGFGAIAAVIALIVWIVRAVL